MVQLHDAQFVPRNGLRRDDGRLAVLLGGTPEGVFLLSNAIKQIVEVVKPGFEDETEEADMLRIVGLQTDNPDALRLDPVPQVRAGRADEHGDDVHPILHRVSLDRHKRVSDAILSLDEFRLGFVNQIVPPPPQGAEPIGDESFYDIKLAVRLRIGRRGILVFRHGVHEGVCNFHGD